MSPAEQLTAKSTKGLPKTAWLIICLSVLLIVGRTILWHVYFDPTDKRDQKFIENREAVTGMHCANDRSRWATVATLVENNTFVIDDVDRRRGKLGNWGTIDKVYHSDRKGREHFYSSKPPLYTTIVAIQYWLLKQVTGLNIFEAPMLTIKILTFINQGLVFALILILLARIGHQEITNNHLYYLYLTALSFGTFLSTFAVSLNNHLPAALFSLLAVLECRRISLQPHNHPARFVLIGFYCAMTVTFELPSLAFLCLVGIWLLTISIRNTIFIGVPAIAVVAFLYLGINYLAHDSWRPPYTHRSDGKVLEVLSLEDGDSLVAGILPDNLDLLTESMPGMGNYRVEEHPSQGRWRIFDYSNNVRYALVRKGTTYELRVWDNWYDYEVAGRKSYWLPGQAEGVDLGETSRSKYLLHLTVGHHGFFSLTPIWIFGLLGILLAFRAQHAFWTPLSRITLSITLILFLFYVMRPLQDRNYGGVASGFRWMFWIVPLYALHLPRGLNAVSKSFFLTVLFIIAVAISIYSAHYAILNPWQNPWPY